MKVIVTTIYRPTPEIIAKARYVAQTLAVPFVSRLGNSIEKLRAEYATNNIVVVTTTFVKLLLPDGECFFHIGMAKLRIKGLREGQSDHMIAAMQLSPGDSVVDCTLGLAADAIVASYIVGGAGQVTGLETVPVLAELTRLGLAEYNPADPEIEAAMRRIAVINTSYENFLRDMPSQSADVVYFDPMFRQPIKASSGLAPLRLLADHHPVTFKAIAQAKRIARKRVVLKESAASHEFAKLGFSRFCGGRYSSVAYGYIQVGEGNDETVSGHTGPDGRG